MADQASPTPVEAAVLATPKLSEGGSAARFSAVQATRLPLQNRWRAFTLAELLVSVFVLGVLVFLLTQLLNSATIITILGNKRMDADSQARMVFDRMAVDFSQMVKRSDVDYYLKNPAANPPAPQTNQNDQI